MPSLDPHALREARLRAGLTQHQLAVLIGVGGGERISAWELGAAHPRPASIAKLAVALGTPPQALLGGEPLESDLRTMRVVRGLSAQDVADRLNVSVATYRRWEAGRHRNAISDSVIADLARVLRVSQGDLRQIVAEHPRPR